MNRLAKGDYRIGRLGLTELEIRNQVLDEKNFDFQLRKANELNFYVGKEVVCPGGQISKITNFVYSHQILFAYTENGISNSYYNFRNIVRKHRRLLC